MSALVRKEIRLLLPLWIGTLALLVLAAGLLPANIEVRFFAVGVCCIVLAAASYGMEFSYGTFSLLLSQPASRARIWKAKAAVLAAALLSVGLAFAMCQKIAPTGPLGRQEWLGLLFDLSTAAGAFCAAILVRQIFAAFWLAWLIPLAILALSILATGYFEAEADHPRPFLFGSLVLYAGFGIWWSWRSYFLAQDLTSAGDRAVTFSWSNILRPAAKGNPVRRPAPWRALAAKELRLQTVALTAMGSLFLFHLGVLVALRIPHDIARGHWSELWNILNVLTVGWSVIPLLVGSAIVSEEQRLGIADTQYCLPFSRRRIFAFKTCVALLVGVLLPAVFFLLLGSKERIELQFSIFKIPEFDFPMTCLVFASIAFTGILASTFARQSTEAFVIGFILVVVLAGAVTFAFRQEQFQIGKQMLWRGREAGYLLVLAIPVVLPWLAWLNYRNPYGVRRHWRTVAGLLALMAFPTVFASAIYHRTWDYLLPTPPRGVARLTVRTAPKFVVGGELLVSFPDGRLWRSVENYRASRFLGQEFVSGSNWRKVACYGNVYALRNDGTLWSSPVRSIQTDEASWKFDERLSNDDPQMVQFGSENDWIDLIRSDRNLYLLKTNGTLWQLMPSARENPEHVIRLGDEADWKELLENDLGLICIRNAKGEIWTLITTAGYPKTDSAAKILQYIGATFGDKSSGRQLDAKTWIYRHPLIGGLELDHWRTVFRNIEDGGHSLWLGIRGDGTLWTWKPGLEAYRSATPGSEMPSPQRVGDQADWQSIVRFRPGYLLLKGDGTIWKWDDSAAKIEDRLTLFDKHDDWVALANPDWEPMALSNSGNLYRFERTGGLHEIFIGWRGVVHYRDRNSFDEPDQPRHFLHLGGIKLASPRRPTYLGNIFEAQNSL